MSKKTDSNSYTMIFAVGMVLVVGSLLAFLASSLKPNIDENKRIEKQQNILYAMGVNENDDSNAIFVSTTVAEQEFQKYIKRQLVIEGDDISEDEKAYMIDVKKEKSKAKNGGVRRLPLFVGEKDGKTFYVAPIRGKGLWDAIWGYVAMDENMIVQGAYFDHKGETPGLGANIKQRYFMDDFIEFNNTWDNDDSDFVTGHETASKANKIIMIGNAFDTIQNSAEGGKTDFSDEEEE